MMEILVAKLRAALSWEVAPQANNPGYQAWLDSERARNPEYHINPLGANNPRWAHLFEDQYQEHGEEGTAARRQAFIEHLERCSAIVSTWPEWKRTVLGRVDHRDAESR